MDPSDVRTRRGNNNTLRVDFSDYQLALSPLKADHKRRPLWTCPDNTIFLDASHDLYVHATDFLASIAEPVTRGGHHLHQYRLTEYSLYAAVATNITTETIVTYLDRFSKNALPTSVAAFVRERTEKHGKAKLVLKHNQYHVESEFPHVLRQLLQDPLIAQARGVIATQGASNDVNKSQIEYDDLLVRLNAMEEDTEEDEDDWDVSNSSSNPRVKPKPATVISFQVKGNMDTVELVKRQAMALGYPLLEEYDYRNDKANEDIPRFNLRPEHSSGEKKMRPYQVSALSKMFDNGRARSGVIVLPCGAGKTLTGIAAAQTIKKSILCLCFNVLSVHQWKSQFQFWTSIPDEHIAVLTSDQKDKVPDPCVLITTYGMLTRAGNRNVQAQEMMDSIIRQREWGLLLMDEVHKAPAATFRQVASTVKAHCRLGLTATLVREDDLISDLAFLVGPKLYEANWMDLTAQGFLASVQCVEVCCPMTGPFMTEYRKDSLSLRLKQLLCVMNPNKVRSLEFLVRFHEDRGDRIIVFSDLVYPLEFYARMLLRPMIHGNTKEWEREAFLKAFRANEFNTLFLSRVGDMAIDLPEANVVIQVCSFFGSRQQEAQRLGRILRPKSAKFRNDNGTFDAYFYTLVSDETKEMEFSARRQQFLVDQGYTFKIVTDLLERVDNDPHSTYTYTTGEDDRKLLRMVLNSEQNSENDQRSEERAIEKRNATY